MNLSLLSYLAASLFTLSAEASHLRRDFAEPRDNRDACREMMAVDLTTAGLGLKASSGGTSAYAKIVLPGEDHPAGIFLPPNSSGIIDGEVTAYRVALLLGQADYVQPGTLRALEGEELARFQKFMIETEWKHEAQKKNQKKINALIARQIENNEPLFVAVKCWNRKPVDYDQLLSADNTGLNTSAPEAKWIRSDQPQPSDTATVTLKLEGKEGTSTEGVLARELSTQFLIDAIMGQWDRFSGGNLQVIFAPGGDVHFGLFDNGGTWGEDNDVAHTLSYVTRFERKAADTVLELDQALSLNHKFHGAKEQELKEFLEMDQEFSAENWETLKGNVKATADHIRAVTAPDSEKYFN